MPFRAGIAAGADVVMSAHIAFPALTGGDDPGTLSAAVLTGLLRDSLRFSGLVVTDALTMGAIVAKYGAGEAAVRAFLAGSDLLLMPANPDSAEQAMLDALATGRYTEERLDASLRRLLEFKKRLGLFEHRTVPLDKVMQTVGTRRWQGAAEDIAVRSVTLVRDTAGTVAGLRGRRSHLALVAYADEATTAFALHLAELLRQNGDTVDYFRLWPMSGPASYDSARLVLGRAPVALFASNVKPISWKGNIALPDSLAALIATTDSLKPTVLDVIRESVSPEPDADGEELSRRLERRARLRARRGPGVARPVADPGPPADPHPALWSGMGHRDPRFHSATAAAGARPP